jgi:lipopolysaccharide export system ATP-binding protein
MLKISNLYQKIQDVSILENVSLKIKPGEITALLGPNGAGKTTLLKTIIGLLPTLPHNKTNKINIIELNKKLINSWPTNKRVESGLAYLPQQTSLFNQLSVIDNLAIVYQYHPHWAEKNWPDFSNTIKKWTNKIGLDCPLEQKADSLSGGQKRKLEVIRTILMKPKIAMFDEPFAGVDPKSIYELKEIFSDMAEKQSIAVVISDHNVDQLLSIANYIYVIIDGKVVTHGGIKEILNDSKTKNSYFGNQFYSEISERFL